MALAKWIAASGDENVHYFRDDNKHDSAHAQTKYPGT